ncbi:MAG: Ig-like domain-containing protein [Candidatus Thiodiazotropha sp.]
MTPISASTTARFLVLFILLTFSFVITAQAAPKGDKGKPPETLRIISASYDGVLSVKGDRAARRTQVTVSNANPAISQAWTTSSNQRGQWELDVNGPQPVPCRISASDGVNQATADVTGAPADCDGTVVVNQPPTAVDDSAQTNEDQPVTINLLANDSDPDGSLAPATLEILRQCHLHP